MSQEIETKINALSSYLEVLPDDIDQGYNWYGEYPILECGSSEYLVLTDEEADHACKLYIEEGLWAFNAWFIVQHSVLPYRDDTIELIQGYQEDKCEDANDTIKSLISDMDEFVEDAISADGRGHFLNGYDGTEEELEYEAEEGKKLTFYIYQIN